MEIESENRMPDIKAETWKKVLLMLLMMAVIVTQLACCPNASDELTSWEKMESLRAELRSTISESDREQLLTLRMTPEDRTYLLFPSEVAPDEIYVWTDQLLCSLEDQIDMRRYLISVVLEQIDQGNPIPRAMLELGVELVPDTKAVKFSRSGWADEIDEEILSEELRTEYERLLHYQYPAYVEPSIKE